METLTHHDQIIRLKDRLIQKLSPLCKDVPQLSKNIFINSFISDCHFSYYLKNEVIEDLKPAPNNYLHFVASGIACTFRGDPKPKKKPVSNIWTRDNLIFDVNAFHYSSNAYQTSYMLEEGHILSISYTSFKKLIAKNPILTSIQQKMQIEHQLKLQKHNDLLQLSIPDRVIAFLNDHPTIVNRINQDILASYLGMSRVTFNGVYNKLKIKTT